MPLQATSGAASYDAFGGGVPVEPNYIESVFQTYLYTPATSNTAINIPNGVDLSTKGGMVWFKKRSGGTQNHSLVDTVRGGTNLLTPNDTFAAYTASIISSFNTNGFTTGDSSFVSIADQNFVSWTFRKQPKFFDVVTYTGNGVLGREIPHNLGSVPGCMIIKRTDSTGSWAVYHRSLASNQALILDGTNASFTATYFNSTAPTSTVFTVGAGDTVNGNGFTYVAYLFAHNAGGFGLTGTDNVISCGSFTCDGSGNATIDLGYEPQWILRKASNEITNWEMFDNMRGLSVTDNETKLLYSNLSNAEENTSKAKPTATGFIAKGEISKTYIYIAIRRGPMKVPTSGTSVFAPSIRTGTGTTTTVSSTSFPPDLYINGDRTYGGSNGVFDRLRGRGILQSFNTAAENATSPSTYDFVSWGMNGEVLGAPYNINMTGSGRNFVDWNFGRAPSFMDVVCYTGTGVDLTVNHNLGVVPEWVIIKNRSRAGTNWSGAYFANASEYYDLRLNQDIGRSLVTMGPDGPTLISNSATTFGVLGGSTLVNFSGDTYVAYLFASCPGVSKCGSYTGTGTTQQINCGFTAGARFVLIKRTDSTGDWYVWDSARGIVAGNDPYLLLNSTAAEVTNTDYVDTYSAGFEISSTAPADINASGGSFIFLAVA